MSLDGFGARLKELMELENLSRRSLSLKTGLQRKSIMNWIDGKFYPSCEALIKLSAFFGVSVDYLLGLKDSSDTAVCSESDPEAVSIRFLKKLNFYMEENHISKYSLAKSLHKGQTTVTRWFKNGSLPETATLIQLASVMNETVEFLLEGASSDSDI